MKKAKCNYAFRGRERHHHDLIFEQGEIIYILECRENGWWKAKNKQGKNGIVPYNYLTLCEEGSNEDVEPATPPNQQQTLNGNTALNGSQLSSSKETRVLEKQTESPAREHSVNGRQTHFKSEIKDTRSKEKKEDNRKTAPAPSSRSHRKTQRKSHQARKFDKREIELALGSESEEEEEDELDEYKLSEEELVLHITHLQDKYEKQKGFCRLLSQYNSEIKTELFSLEKENIRYQAKIDEINSKLRQTRRRTRREPNHRDKSKT